MNQSLTNPNLNNDFTKNSLDLFYTCGIRTIFAIPGAHIEHFILEVANDSRFQLIIAAHEEGAGFLADGYFRKSHEIPVVATINGPGATNLMTSIATAQLDHSSVLYLTGDTAYQIKDKLGFQTSSVLDNYTVHCIKTIVSKQLVPISFNDLYQGIMQYTNDFKHKKYYPMHINLHNDISKSFSTQIQTIKLDEPKYSTKDFHFYLDHSVVVFGEEYRDENDLKQIIDYCSIHRIPMVCTLGAKNMQALIPEDLFCGVYGYAGHLSAIDLVSNSMVKKVYFLNTELNERNTMNWSPRLFQTDREIFVINREKIEHGISEFNIQSFECSMSEFVRGCFVNEVNEDWFSQYTYHTKVKDIEPNKALEMDSSLMIMNQHIHKSSNFFLDSGDHRIYGSIFWDVRYPNTFFTASKTAPMGWAIGAAIGASFADRNQVNWVLTGDGCMLMHGNEISVAQRYHANVKFIVINNGSYGRIEYRLLKEDDRIKDKISRLPKTSWANYANSFGIPAICVQTEQELLSAIEVAQNYNGPYLIEIMIKIDHEVDIKTIFSSTANNFKPFWEVE